MMKCPVCADATLVMSERQGIEIDYCPQCRGVWLDRGELDKIIERSTAVSSIPASPPLPQQPSHSTPVYQDRQNYDRHGYNDRHHGGHNKSFWKDLFD
jgi:Zn-finger nucleic acid-binding protein